MHLEFSTGLSPIVERSGHPRASVAATAHRSGANRRHFFLECGMIFGI